MFYSFALFLLGSPFACGTSETLQTPTAIEQTPPNVSTGHIGLQKATAAFPPRLSSYEFVSLKEKRKSEQWVEYSATYQKGNTKLKVVVNEHLPEGNPEWLRLFEQLEKKTTKGHKAAFEAKTGKSSWMVIVDTRFRVDFKSARENEAALQELAEKFRYDRLPR